MSGAKISSAGAATFQMASTLSVGPPLSELPGAPGLSGSRSAALAYRGNGYTALPAAATCPTYFATDQAWKQTSASGPKASCQFGDGEVVFNCIAVSTSGCTDASKSFCAVEE